MNFLVQDHQKLPKQFPECSDKLIMAESYTRVTSNSPTSGAETFDFKNDVMFSSASMLESQTDGGSTVGNIDATSRTNPLIYSTRDSIVFTDRFGQNLSTDLSVNDIKQEPTDESNDDTFYQSSSESVFPDMIHTPSRNSKDLGINSTQSESSQNNVDFVIKQEPLTDEDETNDDRVENTVFGDYLLKTEMDDTAQEQGHEQIEESSNKRKLSDENVGLTFKRARRTATGKCIEKMEKDFELDEMDGNDYLQNDDFDDYSPSTNLEEKKSTSVKKISKLQTNPLFSFENLNGNTLNIKGASKKLHVKILRCPECHDIFTYESVFKKHMKKHTGDLPFKCKHCNLGFTTQFSHDLHSRQHTQDKLYRCGMCGLKVKLKKDLKEHHITHVLTRKAQGITDLATTNEPKVETASVPQQTSENENQGETDLSPFGCSMCNFVAKDFAEIGKHVMEDHFVDRCCLCDICSRRFTNNDDLKLHKSSHIKNFEEISCGICEEIVDSREDLMKHLDIHPEAKPYKCCQCGDKFIVLPQLQAHMQSHSFTKRYNCTYCQKQFFHEDTLESHLRVHTGEIAFKCSVCNKGFRARDRLTRHMRRDHNISTPPDIPPDSSKQVAMASDETNRAIYPTLLERLETAIKLCYNDPSKETTENTGVQETHVPDWKKDLGCNVDISGENSYLNQLKLRANKKKISDSTCTTKCELGPADSTDKAPDISPAIKEETSTEDNVQSHGDFPRFVKKEDVENNINAKNTLENYLGMQTQENNRLPVCDIGNNRSLSNISVKNLTNFDPNKSSNIPEDPYEHPALRDKTKFVDVVKTMELKMNIFPCDVCGAMFAYKNMLQKHMKKHTGQEPYRCEECNRGFMSQSSLKTHSRIHSGERPFICHVCQKTFRQKNGLTSHLLTVHKSNVSLENEAQASYDCQFCDRKFKLAVHYQEHLLKHTLVNPYGPYICNICNIGWTCASTLETHVNRVHFLGKEHVCLDCSKRFDTVVEMAEHQNSHDNCTDIECGICGHTAARKTDMSEHLKGHPEIQPYKCMTCEVTFSLTSQIVSHMETHKEGEKTFQCSECDFSFTTNDELIFHQKFHSTVCKVCKRNFESKTSLENHMTEHSEQKLYPCKYCDQVFSSGTQRWAHSATHDVSRPYSCAVCGKRYINKGSLESHEETHKLDRCKEFHCSECDETFSRKIDMSKHKKAVHKSKHSPKTGKYGEESSNNSKPKKKKKQKSLSELLVLKDNIDSEIPEGKSLSSNEEVPNVKTELLSPDNEYGISTQTDHDTNRSSSVCGSTEDNFYESGEICIKQEPITSGYDPPLNVDGDTLIKKPESDNWEQSKQSCELVCNICHEVFHDLETLQYHQNRHLEEIKGTVTEEFICSECGALFWKKVDLQKHIRKQHNETTKIAFKSKLEKVKNTTA